MEKDLLYARVRDKFLIDVGCWEWRLSKNAAGYGQLTVDGEKLLAHRVVYELFVGPIPPGRQIDHLCRNRACVRPDHMELVTPRENTLRGISPAALHARKTHCPQGHPYDEANTYRHPVKGNRKCRACHREAWHRRSS